jgi:hypothetical protein
MIPMPAVSGNGLLETDGGVEQPLHLVAQPPRVASRATAGFRAQPELEHEITERTAELDVPGANRPPSAVRPPAVIAVALGYIEESLPGGGLIPVGRTTRFTEAIN